tara:strand:- start:278 stop:727 length:450 start_codon:yes stop_codon:yes gene_type:complete
MKVILIQDVDNLGKIGDSVNVKNGYARNFLIPKKLALFANNQNMKSIESMIRQQEMKTAKERSNLESLAKIIDKVTLKFELKAGEEGKLFGSVTSQMISDELAKQDLTVDKKEIILEDPIKELGKHKVDVSLGENLSASIQVKVTEESK